LHVPSFLLELHVHHANTRDAVCFLEEQLEVGLTLVTYCCHLRVSLIVAVTVFFEFQWVTWRLKIEVIIEQAFLFDGRAAIYAL
jgi:hypothetical protein